MEYGSNRSFALGVLVLFIVVAVWLSQQDPSRPYTYTPTGAVVQCHEACEERGYYPHDKTTNYTCVCVHENKIKVLWWTDQTCMDRLRERCKIWNNKTT